MGHIHGVDSEVGRLRTVLAHRPGAELLRITPAPGTGCVIPACPGWPGRCLFQAGLATSVLAVPLHQLPEGTRLDMVCTVVDRDMVLMFPALGYVLQAHVITRADGVRIPPGVRSRVIRDKPASSQRVLSHS